MREAIHLQHDDLEVEIWPLGARLNGVWFQGVGNLVARTGIREEGLNDNKYHGAVVGPVANRIAGATADIDGQTYTFEANERESTTLHSGSTGTHAQDWQVDYHDERHLILTLSLQDGMGGFPGNRVLVADYRLIGSSLVVSFEAGTEDKPTWMNLALHPYWTLGLSGRGGQKIKVNADRYLPVDEMQIPTGEIAEVRGTRFDLREIKVPSTEIDHNFCLNDDQSPAVIVEGDSGMRMDVTTDAPGMQIFTGKEVGIAIEPQHWPDAMHHPHFPSIEIRPGQGFSQSTTYRFTRL